MQALGFCPGPHQLEISLSSRINCKTILCAIIVIYTTSVLYYTTYAVVLNKGMPLVHHILLKIRNIMGPAEILLCVLLHFTHIRSFKVDVHSKQDASKIQGESERN